MRRVIQCGVGGYGELWLETLGKARDRVDVVGLVDTNVDALGAAGARLGVDSSRQFTDLAEALAQVDADSLVCVVPPAFHETVVSAALKAGLHVLTEKPLADTMAASRRLAELADASPGALMVAQKGRFHPWVKRFRSALEHSEVGPLGHLTVTFRAAEFFWGIGSNFRHRMADPLLTEMSIHHFDLIRALLGVNAVSVSGASWNPPGSGFEGDVAASLVFQMEGDVPVVYTAYIRSSGDLTSWYGDIRAECDRGAVTMVAPSLYLATRGAHQGVRSEDFRAPAQELASVGHPHDGQALAFAEFLAATDEGREPESGARENLQSVAMMFAAIDACRSGATAYIADYVS
ncbi:Gfo/Idh/MocA family oxidoreductase [Phytohabitans sp. ZYX-F-186]|uniref:Gfo/Idh/MocA family oxidoreductase n=1 Tax=Phytohabitans maris TaxID=3071409 RepID=A0ABU0ZC62_9ACTN|nr:Gfo/Idh/MocA family oxidoreductase [Phytohabitans sp. ZYX-F-186]MDQ7904651.1 Gfo/Idh/MocA family oxidoreductase [Phytohabitans sp. ZYX-F-186]